MNFKKFEFISPKPTILRIMMQKVVKFQNKMMSLTFKQRVNSNTIKSALLFEKYIVMP